MSERQNDDHASETLRSSEQPAGLFERVRALFGLAPASVRDDIEDAIDESVGAEFTPQERAILKNVLALHDVKVADVMVPRADIVALAADTPLRDVLDMFRSAGHSRLPVYEGQPEHIVGTIHYKDLMRAWQERYGRLPSAYDWSRTHARRRGGEALLRLDDGDWPSASVVADVYGSWDAARAAARGGEP